MLHVICSFQAEFEMYEEELRNLQNDLNKKDEKISQLENEQKRLYKKYKSLKGKSRGTIFWRCYGQRRFGVITQYFFRT